MKEVKAIFMDSEGTLKNKNNLIETETINVIDSLEKKGIPVIITTGLPRFISRKIAIKSKATSYLISSNGADIFDLKKNRSINKIYLNKDFLKELYDENKNEFNIILGVGDFEYSNCLNEYNLNTFFVNSIEEIKENIIQCHISQKEFDIQKLSVLKNNLNEKYSFLKNILGESLYEKFLKLDINLLSKEEVKMISRAVSFYKLLTLKNQILKYKNYVSLGNQSLDFTEFQFNGETPWFSFNAEGVSKGNAIKIVCDYLNINPENVVAIGNDYNDRTMINSVGRFYCPSDARPFVKEKTGYIYDSGEIGKVLKKIYEKV